MVKSPRCIFGGGKVAVHGHSDGLRQRLENNWFLRCLSPRLALVNFLGHFIPTFFAYEFRAKLYRWAGCQLGEHVRVLGRIELFGTTPHKTANLIMGEGSDCSEHCLFGVDGQIRIGRRVGIGPGVQIYTTSHELGPSSERSSPFTVTVDPVTIGDGVMLRAGAIILPGVTVGRGAVVAAGAVVAKSVEPNTLVGGVPARVIKQLSEDPSFIRARTAWSDAAEMVVPEDAPPVPWRIAFVVPGLLEALEASQWALVV